jgi:hypothetical protein
MKNRNPASGVGANSLYKNKAPAVTVAQHVAEALRILVGDGPIKQRLASAYSDHLASVTENELPPASRLEFAELQAALTRVAPIGNEPLVRASVQKMSPEEASRHAATILKIYISVANIMERAEPLKVVGVAKNPPHFLTRRS